MLCCDVNQKVLDMIKVAVNWGKPNPNREVQGYFGMLLLNLAKHSDMIDPIYDCNRQRLKFNIPKFR